MDHKPAYYAIIPASVRYCKDLEPGAKLLYGEVTALCHQEGYCWATNRYFAELYGVEERTIRNWLAALVEKNFISHDVERGPKGTQRRLAIHDPQIGFGGGKKFPGGRKEISGGAENFFQNLSSDSPLPNNTSNNTSEYIPLSSPTGSAADASSIADHLLSKIRDWNPTFQPKALEKWTTDIERLIRLDERSPDEIREVVDWVQGDDFWRANVLSGKKLREKFSDLHAKMLSAGNKSLKTTNRQRIQAIVNRYRDTYGRGVWVSDGFQNPATGETITYDTPPEEIETRLTNAFMTAAGYARC